ncbi:MAG TPA: MATE family efflux transporter [Syntrophales bacterium]|nr:MATE family efflux transporter [Syntrophales bacterium]
MFKDRIIDVTTGNIWASIWEISWPMLIMMIFGFFVGFTDVYVAGLISPDVQAAVGFITQIYFLVIIIANAISIGTLAVISRAIGAGETDKAVDTAKQSLILGLLIAAAFTAVCLLFYRGIIALAGFPPQIRDIAEKFLRIFAFALGPNYLLIISNAVFRASAEVKKPLITMLVFSLANIALDFLLVFGIFPFPKLGYPGIALATAISTILGTVMNLVFLWFSRRWRPVYENPGTLSFETIKIIFNIGWPAAFLQIAWNMASIILFNILGRLKESSIVALASIANGLRIEAIIFLPAFALNMAASVIVGQNLGAGDPQRAEQMGWKLAGAGIGITSIMALVIFIWAEGFAYILTREPLVLAETARYIRFNMLSEPFLALSTVMGGGLQGAGDTRGTMWVIIISMWLIRLPLASFLALFMGFGAPGVWSAMVVSMICQGIMMAWWFNRGKWKKLVLQ